MTQCENMQWYLDGELSQPQRKPCPILPFDNCHQCVV